MHEVYSQFTLPQGEVVSIERWIENMNKVGIEDWKGGVTMIAHCRKESSSIISKSGRESGPSPLPVSRCLPSGTVHGIGL